MGDMVLLAIGRSASLEHRSSPGRCRGCSGLGGHAFRFSYRGAELFERNESMLFLVPGAQVEGFDRLPEGQGRHLLKLFVLIEGGFELVVRNQGREVMNVM